MGDIHHRHAMIFSSLAHRPHLVPLCSIRVPLQNFITGTQSINIATWPLEEDFYVPCTLSNHLTCHYQSVTKCCPC